MASTPSCNSSPTPTYAESSVSGLLPPNGPPGRAPHRQPQRATQGGAKASLLTAEARPTDRCRPRGADRVSCHRARPGHENVSFTCSDPQLQATGQATTTRTSSIKTLTRENEPPWGVEPQTYALREIRSPPSRCSPSTSAHVKVITVLSGRHRADTISGHEPGHNEDHAEPEAAAWPVGSRSSHEPCHGGDARLCSACPTSRPVASWLRGPQSGELPP